MKRLILTIFLVCIVLTASAQQNGTISGSVREASTGEALRGATVLVEGTKRGAVTDPKGQFTIKELAPGSYTLNVRYVGYQTKRVTGIKVESGRTTTLAIILDQDRQIVSSEVVVEARGTRETQAALLIQRRNSSAVSDAVSAEDIKRLPDSDAGQAVRRVPSVTLMNDKYIVVRGVGDRYNNAMLNGVVLASTEPDKKAFSYDLVPSDVLESVTITKTFTPDLPGNFTGGMVQMNTVEFPSESTIRVSVGSSINDNAFLQTNRFFSSSSGRLDWLGIDDGTRSALPAGIPSDRRQMSALISAVRNPFDTTGARARWSEVGRTFNNNNWQLRQRTLTTPNTSLSILYSNVASLADNELGIVATLNYGKSWSVSSIERSGLLADRALAFSGRGFNPSQTTSLGGMLNLALRMGAMSTISLRSMLSHTADEDIVVLNGQEFVRILDMKQIGIQYVQKTLASIALSGEHTLGIGTNTAIDWRVGYNATSREEPDFRRFRFARIIPQNGHEEPYTSDIISMTPLGQGDGVRAGRFFSNLDEAAWSGGFNFLVPMGMLKVKSGALHERRQRNFRARSFTYVPGPEFALDYEIFTLPDSVQWADPSRIFQPENIGPHGIGISEDSRLSDAYSAAERLWAGYLMGDISLDDFGLPLRLIGGVRYEHNQQTLASYDLNDRPVNVNLITGDWLPALSAIVKITPQMNFRLAGSQTLARPALREFAPFAFYDFTTQSQVMGNPTLTRSLATNLDARWEWFTAPGEVVSAGVFYKRILHAIEETIYLEQQEIARTFRNAEEPATNYGLELEFRKRLDIIGSWGENIMVSCNYSRIFSEIAVRQGGQVDRRPMWGQSPYTLNASVSVVLPEIGATATVGYNVFGRRIVLVGLRNAYLFEDPHTYELPRDVIDFSLSKRLGDFDVRLSVRDLLNQPLRWEQGDTIVQSTIRGRSISIGISYKVRQ